jgi:hypothetical protein
MLKESGFQLAQELELDASPDREPDQPQWLANTSWIQGFSNQEALLEAFAAPLIEQQSFVLFYTTRTPLVDDERRIILGAALLDKKHGLAEYSYKPGNSAILQAMVWERPLQHSLRPVRGAAGLTGGGSVARAGAQRRPRPARLHWVRPSGFPGAVLLWQRAHQPRRRCRRSHFGAGGP